MISASEIYDLPGLWTFSITPELHYRKRKKKRLWHNMIAPCMLNVKLAKFLFKS